MYIKRDDNGNIKLVSREAMPDCREFLPLDAPELLAFVSQNGAGKGGAHFQSSDLAFVRVLEDVIEVLMDKGLISFTDLPEAAQQKVMERQTLRRRLNSIELMSETDEEGGVI